MLEDVPPSTRWPAAELPPSIAAASPPARVVAAAAPITALPARAPPSFFTLASSFQSSD